MNLYMRSAHVTILGRSLANGMLLLLFLALSCRSTNTDPSKTPPGVSLRVWGTRINVTDGTSDSFEVLVGAGYPSPGLVTNVNLSDVRIEAIASQPDKGLGELRLTINTLAPEESCFRKNREGIVETAAPVITPTDFRMNIDHPLPLNPVGLLMINDFNIYNDYLRQFECPVSYELGATVTIQATARNIAGKGSTTPMLQLRFLR